MLPKLRGNALSELQLELGAPPEKPPDLSAAAGAVTSSCTGSLFSFRLRPPGGAEDAELDLAPEG